MSEKILFTGTTHTSGGSGGAAKSADGFLDIKLPQPHPAAENLFAAAWSACYIGALELAAGKKKITLSASPEVDNTIELILVDGAFFLRAHLKVNIPGVDKETAQALVEDAHGICPYSKATKGNIKVETTLV
jgi:osmotically inducible protein OsmC